MIREEYEKQLEDKSVPVEKKVKMSNREIKGRQKYGVRGYIGKTLSDNRELKKAVNFSTLFTLIVSIFCLGGVYLAGKLAETKVSQTLLLVLAIITIVLAVWYVVWLVVICPIINKKTERLLAELEEMQNAEKKKQMIRYEKYKKMLEEKEVKTNKK